MLETYIYKSYINYIYSYIHIVTLYYSRYRTPIKFNDCRKVNPATKCYQCYADVPFEVITLMARSASIQAVSKPRGGLCCTTRCGKQKRDTVRKCEKPNGFHRKFLSSASPLPCEPGILLFPADSEKNLPSATTRLSAALLRLRPKVQSNIGMSLSMVFGMPTTCDRCDLWPFWPRGWLRSDHFSKATKGGSIRNDADASDIINDTSKNLCACM